MLAGWARCTVVSSFIDDLVREFSKSTNTIETKTSLTLTLDPWNNVSHEICINTVDDAAININHLKQHPNLGIPGDTIDTNLIYHPPDPIHEINDLSHSRLD